jgi:site-specific DNA-methyltransferase (adenine-specific)
MVFADPPFNLNKDYGEGVTDRMTDEDYLQWCKSWLDECVRILRPGGALFLFNLPKWNIELGAHLNRTMEFRHWIACRMPKSLPIPKRLSPAHYGLLYYTKGKPATFNSVRVPVQTCRHCGGEIRDYGGHRDKLNPAGLNLMDVFDAPDEVWEEAPDPLPSGQAWTKADDIWDDIPPVRHSRYKHRSANALAPIMLERLIALATNPGDTVVDPFCGTGTTAYAAEVLHRRWLSIELGETEPAIQRLKDYAAGDRAQWESGRGNGKRRSVDKRGRPIVPTEPQLDLG